MYDRQVYTEVLWTCSRGEKHMTFDIDIVWLLGGKFATIYRKG